MYCLTITEYNHQVIGRSDSSIKGKSVGHPLDTSGPVVNLTICESGDETSWYGVQLSKDNEPYGCHFEQELLKLRFYWRTPTHTGYVIHSNVVLMQPVTVLTTI